VNSSHHRAVLSKDISDVRYRAARWREGNRISEEVYDGVCRALDTGFCPQAVMMALVDLAFNKRNEAAPRDRAQIFWSIVRNQQTRIRWWADHQPEQTGAPGGEPDSSS